jgi:hypothetical protein
MQSVSEEIFGEDWTNREVLAVTFPAPPLKALDTVYAEDCWSSNALEMGSDVFFNKGNTVIASKFTDRGPAFVVKYRLGQLINTSTRKGKFKVNANGIYCATIGYKKLFSSSGTEWATEANIEGLSLGSSSCHPASHTSIPLSPCLTSILQLNRAMKVDVGSFKFADDIVSQKYFPNVDFNDNIIIDDLFNVLSTQHVISSSGGVKGGLSNRILKTCLPQFNTNNFLWSKYGNNIVKLKTIHSKLNNSVGA